MRRRSPYHIIPSFTVLMINYDYGIIFLPSMYSLAFLIHIISTYRLLPGNEEMERKTGGKIEKK